MDRLQYNVETIHQGKSEMSIVAASSPETGKPSFSVLSVCKAINSISSTRFKPLFRTLKVAVQFVDTYRSL